MLTPWHEKAECLECPGLKTLQSGTLGQKGLLGSFGGMFVDYSQEAGRWDTLTRAANQAIAGAPETPFNISVRMEGAGR